ncbi:hypothetical protein FUA23_21995 [Neolewinella aurantiaca]|uniref:Uncharacterized protein n=1 Tax=Neolewinella aurantiaca TaxID=2602767 RepID=A0A5C7EZH2_9BACT|nr:hypothetical protein [Neolewinella aurantiaca]TXF81444.1 hypothetical protein FUA23_21995 [Neolewinella aurantiaca]
MDSTFQFSKTLTALSNEYGLDLKTFKKTLGNYEICLPSGVVFAPYQKWIYDWLGYPPSVNKSDYADTELPLNWIKKCSDMYEKGH